MSTTVIIVRADVPQQRGPSLAWGLTYLRTWTGILKMAEMVFSLIAFLCSVSVSVCYNGCGWVNFATIFCFIGSSVWFLLHLINILIPNIFRHHIVEMILVIVFAVFMFIAGIVVAVGAGEWPIYRSLGASAFFCFFTMILLGFDAALTLTFLRELGRSRRGAQVPPEQDAPVASTSGTTTGRDQGRQLRPSAPAV